MSTSSSKSRNRTIPMRVRRRQSDAKWRASVASCYESLKLIIPDSKKVNRKKISKVLILQEAENHIEFLEDILSTLLQEKTALLENDLQPAQNYFVSLEKFKEDFAKKIQPPVHSIPRPRHIARAPTCPRVAIPTVKKLLRPAATTTTEPYSDTIICRLFEGENYHYLNNSTSMALNFHNREDLSSDQHYPYHQGIEVMLPISSEPDPLAGMYHVYGGADSLGFASPQHMSETLSSNIDEFNSEMSITMRLTPRLSDSTKENKPENFLLNVTPKKEANPENSSLCSPWKYAALNSIQHHPAFLTPSKVTRQLPFGSPLRSPGCKYFPQSPAFGSPSHLTNKRQPLTPIQLHDTFMEVPFTPSLRSDDITDDEKDETRSLLCTESMETMELGDEEEWQLELEEIELKRSREGRFKELQQTPYQEDRNIDYSSSISGDMALQMKPRKRANLFSEETVSDVTPAKSARHGKRPKCCKQLESLYEKEEKVHLSKLNQIPVNIISIPSHSECSNFDGYFYFYRQMTEKLEKHLSRAEMESPRFAKAMSQIWADMNEEDKTTLVTIAALENSRSSSTQLSDDLTDISLTPITNVHSNEKEELIRMDPCLDIDIDGDCSLQCVPLNSSFSHFDDATIPFAFRKNMTDVNVKMESNLENINFGKWTDSLVKSLPAIVTANPRGADGDDGMDKEGCQVVPFSSKETTPDESTLSSI